MGFIYKLINHVDALFFNVGESVLCGVIYSFEEIILDKTLNNCKVYGMNSA